MKFFLYALMSSILFLLAGCQQGMVSVGAIRPSLDRVIERHDNYVKSGFTPSGDLLTDVEIQTQLRTTELLNQIMDEAENTP